MSFKFDFGFDEEVDTIDTQQNYDIGGGFENSHPAVEVPCPDITRSNISYNICKIRDGFYMKTSAITKGYIQDGDNLFDIIPNQYEGGHAIWECSLDLTRYISESLDLTNIESKRVLELGCGHALPGITALVLGYGQVVFSDFNEEVLTNTTWPNILLNASDEAAAKAKCYAGDWLNLSKLLEMEYKFDVIIAAETLYNEATTRKTWTLISNHLTEDGIAILATKRYYFGVGGGIAALQMIVSENQHTEPMSIEILQSFEDGASNIRDLILIKKLQI